MRRLIIISPYFPPSNTADMQRIRMSLPYFKQFGWEAEVIQVFDRHLEVVKDPLLLNSIPAAIRIHEVDAFPKSITSKLGLGSIALRSMYFYMKKVDLLLKEKKADLIYFSTTQYPLCILGAYWKKKFGVPFVIDMQDPWHSDYYKDKPKHERPSKYWFSYRLNKYLEPVAMRACDGIISVSHSYINDLEKRYPNLRTKPMQVITFGAFEKDLQIVKDNINEIPLAFEKENGKLNLVYIGRGGADMRDALKIMFLCLKKGIKEQPALFATIKLYFIGTSYAPSGQGKPSIRPVAADFGLEHLVTENTDRVPFYSGLASLMEADGLVVPGSNDAGYTASKLYPYIMSEKPLLGIFHKESSAVRILKECSEGQMITLDERIETAYEKMIIFIQNVRLNKKVMVNWAEFSQYTAAEMTRKQCELFNQVIS